MNKKDKMIGDMVAKNHISAIRISAVLLIIIVLALIVMYLRGKFITVQTYYVTSQDASEVTIVGLADLHGHMIGNHQDRIVKKVAEVEPDIIVYLGDMVERLKAEESVEPLVELTEQLIQIGPVYYIDGNHELDFCDDFPEVYKRLDDNLAELGAVKLDNEIVRLEFDRNTHELLSQVQSTPDELIAKTTAAADGFGDIVKFEKGNNIVVNLCGISTHYNWDDEDYAIVEDLRGREGNNILLCHYPESVLWYQPLEGGGLDLVLCGHTHGGLVRVPFIGGLYAPEAGWWPMYDLGEYPIYSDTTLYNYGGDQGAEYWGTMIISGGLAGEHGVPRVNNPMEISVVEIGE